MLTHSTSRIHTKFCVHIHNITHPHKVWCSYTQHYAPTQSLVFIHSTLRTHTKFGVHTLNITHPHKLVFIHSTLRTHTKFGVLTLNITHPHKLVFIHSTLRTYTNLCSYTQHYAPTQTCAHTLNITHPHKIPGNIFCLSDLQPYRRCVTFLKYQHQLL